MKSTLILLAALLPAALFGAGQAVTVSQDSAHTGTFNTAGVTSYVIGQPVTFTGGTTYNPLPIQASLTTIALLRSYTITSAIVNGSAIQVTGYYAQNDGGGGVYVWNSTSTATDNGGSIIQPTGVATGRWLLQYSGQVNVRWFGAYGDGTHDDTAAFTNAIGTGDIVFVPYGTYKITSTLALTQAGIVGEGWGEGGGTNRSTLVFYNLSSSTSAAITTRQATTSGAFIRIENLYIVASSWDPTTGANGYGLDIEARVRVSNVIVSDFGADGIFLHANIGNTGGPYQSLFENVSVNTCGHNGVLIASGANNITFINLISFWNGAPSYNTIPSVAGTYDGLQIVQTVSPYPTYTPQGIAIVGGDCSYNSRYGWNLSQVTDSYLNCGYSEGNIGATQNNVGVSCSGSVVRFPVGSVTNNASNNDEAVYGALVLPNTPGTIRSDTSDGADNKYISLTGGGAASNARGGLINAVGNEYATASAQGIVELIAGYDAGFSDPKAGSIFIQTGNAGQELRMWRSGGVSLISSGTPTDPGAGAMKIDGAFTAGGTITSPTLSSTSAIQSVNGSTTGGQGFVQSTDPNGISNFQLKPSSGSSGWVGIVNPTYSNVSFPAFTPGATNLYSPGDVALVADGTGKVRIQVGSGSASKLAMTFNSAAAIQFPQYGAGTLTTDASGNITATSDARLKNVGPRFTRGLDAVLNLHPRLYAWKSDPKQIQYAGFIAQDVQRAIPEAVGRMSNGYLTLSDRPIEAALVNAAKEMAQRLRIFEAIAIVAVLLAAVSIFLRRS